MSYIKASGSTVEKYPYSIGLLRKDNPNTSFPKRMSDQQLASWNVYPVVTEDDPAHDSATQYVQSASQPTLVNGVWTLAKTVVDYTAQELADKLADKRSGMVITPRQARLALIQTNRLADVEAAIAAMPEPNKTVVQTEWEYAVDIERTSPWISGMVTALGMTEAEMDQLFELAATL